MAETDLKTTDKKSLWQERMIAWEKSGLTQSEFCNQHQLTTASFGYWRTRLKKLSHVSDKNNSPISFFPVKVSPDKKSGLTLDINDHCSIKVHPGFNKNLLIDIIQTIQSI